MGVSDARFADGLRYRIEIPSVEGPEVLRAVLEEADAREVPVRRVSQGSGVMMLTDAEIEEMAALGVERGVEVSLFLGPRGAWDAGGQSFATGAVGGVARGQAGIDWSVAEARRAVARGIRSVLVADAGVLATLGRLKRGRSARDARPQDVGPAAVRQPADGAGARGARRLDDQCLHRSLAGRAPRGPFGLLGAARRVRRGARRPGRVRALLRGSGDDPRRGADVREARHPQRAQHLPGRPPPPGRRGQARPGAGAASRARPPPAGRAGARPRRGPRRRASGRLGDPSAPSPTRCQSPGARSGSSRCSRRR
jgi:hypothetical protein